MTTEWLDDTPEEQAEWDKKGASAKTRTGAGRSENITEQKELPTGKKNRIVFRLLTRKFGESYRHWYTLPDGNKTADNCCCTPEVRANRLATCPVCQYMEAGFGNPGKGLGYDNTAHNYFLLVLFGEIKTVHVQNEAGQLVPKSEGIEWDSEPKIFKVGGMIFDEVWKWRGNPDYPPGANGDLTATNWSVWKEKTSNRTLYPVEFYNVDVRPTHGIDSENKLVAIDLGTATILRDQVIKECEPSEPGQVQLKLVVEQESVPQQSAPQSNVLPQQQPQPAPAPVDQPAPVANDFEIEQPAPVQPQPAPVQPQPASAPAPAQPAPTPTQPPPATRRANPEDKF